MRATFALRGGIHLYCGVIKMKKRLCVGVITIICAVLCLVTGFSAAAETTSATTASAAQETNFAVAIPKSAQAIADATSSKDYSMPFIIGSDKGIVKFEDLRVNGKPKNQTNIYRSSVYDLKRESDYWADFGQFYAGEVSEATTYTVDETTYGVTEPSEFTVNGANEFKMGVLNTENFTSDELLSSSFYFVPVEGQADSYYILVRDYSYSTDGKYDQYSLYAKTYTSNYDGYYQCSNVNYWLTLKYEDPEKSESELAESRTVWTIKAADSNGSFYCYTPATIGYMDDEGYLYTNENSYVFLNAQNSNAESVYVLKSNGLFATPLNAWYTSDPMKLIDHAPTIKIYGNLDQLSQTGYDDNSYSSYTAFRLVDKDSTKNVVMTRRYERGSGSRKSITLPETDSKTGAVDVWALSADYSRYYRDFEDYTDGSVYENDSDPDGKSYKEETSYKAKTVLPYSEYAGKSFYAVLKYTLSYKVTGLAEKNSLYVRTGTLASSEVYAAETDIKSGTEVAQGNWVSIAIPSVNKTGYKYTLESVNVTSGGANMKISKIVDYRIDTLKSGATYIYFKMPAYNALIWVNLKRESAPVNATAGGYFISEDASGNKKYTDTVTAESLSAVKLMAATNLAYKSGIDDDGSDMVYILPEYYFCKYFIGDDDILTYTVDSCKWYVKVGESGQYEAISNGEIELNETKNRATTKNYVYLPSVAADSKVYYKCVYTVKREETGDVSGEKELVLTANVKKASKIPANTMYICYINLAENYNLPDGTIFLDNYARESNEEPYGVGHKLKLVASLYEDYDWGKRTPIPAEDDTVSSFDYTVTWYIQPEDESIEPIALNSTPVKVSPTSADDLEATYKCTLPKLLGQKETDAKIWFEVTKTDKTTSESITFKSKNTATLTVKYSGVNPQILDYDADMVASLEKDNIYVLADEVTKWEYSTDDGATYTEIPLNVLVTREDDVPKDSVRKDPIVSFADVWTKTLRVYRFTATEPTVYTFRLTNDVGNIITKKIDFSALHTHQWGDWIYYSEYYHYRRCTVENCGVTTYRDTHTKNSEGLCVICQDATPDTVSIIYDLVGGDWVKGFNPTTSYAQNETPTLPTAADVQKAGYTLASWSLDDSSSDSEKKYTAQWQCDHTLNTNPRSCTEPTICSQCGATLEKTGHALKDGYSHDAAEHWQTCENCTAKLNAQNHSGGTATCQNQAECAICKEAYGSKDPANHTGQEVWTQTDITHIKKYSCCGAITVAEELHVYSADLTCKMCGYVNNECTHTAGTEWQNDAENHWHICVNEGCGVIIKSSLAKHIPSLEAPTETEAVVCTECGYEIAAAFGHTFDQKNKEIEGALKTPADCTHNAVYYMSCVCGALSADETFEDPNTALGHEMITDSAVAPSCTSTGLTEGYHCSRCGNNTLLQTVVDKIPHEFGDDDICDVCGYDRSHKHSYHGKSDGSYHWQECECGEIADKGQHIYDDAYDPICNSCGYKRFDSPQTDDGEHTAIWVAVMAMSIAAAMITAPLAKKKRNIL